jgi:hypothetical protein
VSGRAWRSGRDGPASSAPALQGQAAPHRGAARGRRGLDPDRTLQRRTRLPSGCSAHRRGARGKRQRPRRAACSRSSFLTSAASIRSRTLLRPTRFGAPSPCRVILDSGLFKTGRMKPPADFAAATRGRTYPHRRRPRRGRAGVFVRPFGVVCDVRGGTRRRGEGDGGFWSDPAYGRIVRSIVTELRGAVISPEATPARTSR